MKKIMTVLSVALMFLVLVSCSNKSEEMVATYEKFVSEYNICTRASNVFWNNVNNEDKAIGTARLENLLNALNTDSSRTISVSTASISTDSSNPTKETVDETTTEKYNNVVINYTYTYNYKDGNSSSKENGTLTVDGKYVTKVLSANAKRGVPDDVEYTYDLTLNGNSHSISYYKLASGKFKSASVGGTAVEVRLLNASK